LVGKPFRRRCEDNSENAELDIRKIGYYELDSSGSVCGPMTGSSEHGNEPSGSIKCCEITEQLSDWRSFIQDSPACSDVTIILKS
jgi:hypothetical protein